MPSRGEPLVSFRFVAKIGDKLKGSFRECTVVSAEHEAVEYKYTDEKGNPGYYVIPGRMKWGRITLKRGMTKDMSMWKWRKEIEDGKVASARSNGSILMCDQDGSPIAEFNFENAWPTKVSGPAPNANTNEIAVEECELAVERIWRAS